MEQLTTEFPAPSDISRSSKIFVKRQKFHTISSLIVLIVMVLFKSAKILAPSTSRATASTRLLTQATFDILYGCSVLVSIIATMGLKMNQKSSM